MKENSDSFIALEFVNNLVPGKFENAQKMLSPECKYSYSEKILEGRSVIDSFIQNHENASRKLDKISYIDGRIDGVENGFVKIIVQDLIEHNEQTHLYTDCLLIKVENDLVIGIKNQPFLEERKKLKEFLDKVGVQL